MKSMLKVGKPVRITDQKRLQNGLNYDAVCRSRKRNELLVEY